MKEKLQFLVGKWVRVTYTTDMVSFSVYGELELTRNEGYYAVSNEGTTIFSIDKVASCGDGNVITLK